MKVLILHTLPPEVSAAGRTVGEFDLGAAARGIAEVLPRASVVGLRGEVREVLAAITAHGPDVVFNVCEAPCGRPDREAHVAALLEWLDVPFTGSGSETLMLCRRKDLANAVLQAAGVRVPRTGGFPCIVKPADEDGSAGIGHHSICDDADALERARARIAGPVIVQEFLPGTEYIVSLWGAREPEQMAIGEAGFEGGLRLFTYSAKWDVDSEDWNNFWLSYEVEMDPPLREAIAATARGAWRALGVRGYARVDIRLDATGVPHVLDVNPNPELSPGLGIYRAVTETGWTWERFVRQQITWALERS